MADLTEEQLKWLREAMTKHMEEYRKNPPPSDRVKPAIEPIYDDVFFEGTKYLDSLAGPDPRELFPNGIRLIIDDSVIDSLQEENEMRPNKYNLIKQFNEAWPPKWSYKTIQESFDEEDLNEFIANGIWIAKLHDPSYRMSDDNFVIRKCFGMVYYGMWITALVYELLKHVTWQEHLVQEVIANLPLEQYKVQAQESQDVQETIKIFTYG